MQPNQFTNETSQTSTQDKELWALAKKRTAFKASLSTYFVMNCFFIAIWYFSSGVHSYFWPIWPMLGWGLGVTLQYFNAYHSAKLFSTEKEYEILKSQIK